MTKAKKQPIHNKLEDQRSFIARSIGFTVLHKLILLFLALLQTFLAYDLVAWKIILYTHIGLRIVETFNQLEIGTHMSTLVITFCIQVKGQIQRNKPNDVKNK